MMESKARLQKSKFAYNRQKTKEEKLKEIEGLPKYIGPYEIIEKLKDGGYSKIYKAISYYTGDFVAIKAIDKTCFQETVEDVLLMIRQTEVLKILKHRNLLSLYEIYETTKYFYLIMDYLPNGDLIEKIIKQKRFKEEEALNIFSQLVDALYYMHQNEICHRDIRTEKILFDANNKPKLVGFSYSTFYDKGKKIRDNYGSLCYACPEIIQNEYYNPELADVWSLGVVLYVMICGYLPFSEEDDEVNKELIINGEVEYPPEISNKVKDLLKHMLDINPNKRYTFQRVIKHPWFKPYNESTLTGGINVYKMIYPIDERILKIIIIYGFKKNEIDMNLKQNKFNEGTALYKQLVDKFIGMGFTSCSDLCSEQFSEFRKDKENTITDGDKKYKKYISKILEKIRKVERYVNEYKKKEDNIVKELETIYSNAEAEEMQKEIELQKNNKKINNVKATNEKNNVAPRVTHRRTISTVKEQKELKEFLASRIGYLSKEDKNRLNNKNKKDIKEIDDDFDFLKDFQKKQSKVCDASSIMYLDDDDYKIKKMRKAPSSKKFKEKEFVQNLLDKADKNEDDEYSLLSNRVDISNLDENHIPKRKRQLSVMIKRKKKKNYLNTSTINDSFLRKPKDETARKKIIKDNLINTVQQVIVEEENLNEENEGKNNDVKKNLFGETIRPVESKKNQKNIKYSLSFGEDDIDEEESGFISKIDSKQVSICYDIDEELKELKEIRNTLKSPAPCRLPYMKKNTKDNKYYNFNIDNNNTIFGENLDENNITNTTNTTALADVNERYDILTQLKKISEGKTPTLSESRLAEENRNIGKNQFNNDSFGDNRNNKGEFNSIRFENETEISFHEDNKISNKKSNNTEYSHNNSNNTLKQYREDLIYYFNDKNTIKKMNDFNKNEEFKLSVSYINSKREKNYGCTYEIDTYPIQKLNINNLIKGLDLNSIELRRLKGKNKAGKNNKENTKKKISKSPNKKTKEKSIIKNSKKSKEITNSKNDKVKPESKDKKCELKEKESSESIDSFMRGNSNIINFFNNEDNLDDTVHIIEDIDDIGGNHENDFNNNNNNNNNVNNNITINSNNNIINNISINNNNHPNNNNNDKTKKSKNKDKNKKEIINRNASNTLDWSKLTNKFKKENKTSLDVLSSFCQPEKPSILSRNENKKDLYNLKLNSHKKTVKFKSTIYNQDNDSPLTKSSLFNRNNNESLHRPAKSNLDEYIRTQANEERTPISLRKKNMSSSVKMPSTHKRVNSRISVEKTLHSNLMSNDFENPNDTNKLIAKVKKGQKIYQSVINDKPSNEKNNFSKTINYSKYINSTQHKQIKNNNAIKEKKPKTNYVQQYHKKLNSSINNNYYTNKKEAELGQKKFKHNKNKSDLIDYDYVFSVYNESNKGKNNSVSKNEKSFHSKNQSTGGIYYQTYRGNDEEDEDDNNLNNRKTSKFKI